MKNKSLIRRLPVKIRSCTLGAVLVLFAFAYVTRAQSSAELLERGIYTEETKGELQTASQIYQQIVDSPNVDRQLLAQAQLRLGLCELKQGHKPQAISALEHLTQEFPDKDKLVALVGQNMPQLLDEMVKQIEQNYILEVDRGELMETALRAIIGKLDARPGILRTNDLEFLGTKEVTQMNESLEQKIGGIGAVLKVDEATHEIIVVSPIPNSPALRGGLLAEDRITTINGSPLPEEKRLETAVKRLRGPVGTAVNVGIKRSAGEFTLQLVRDTVRIASVNGDRYKPDRSWEFMLDDQRKIGYLRLLQVGRQSPAEMQAAVEELISRGMKGLIFDLRNNPGGALAEAVAVADLFVAHGRILTVKGRNGEQVYDAREEGTFPAFPLVVLVNRNTASAAEIIAACLQDHRRAVVVGERTFGQGVVRTLVDLKGGAGALKLPIAAFYRPNGKNMNRYPTSKVADDWGVSPDPECEVMLADEELKQYEKNRHERDILNGPAVPLVEFTDRQLQKALAILNEQLRNQ